MLNERITRAILNKEPIEDMSRDIPDMDTAYDLQQAVVASLSPRFGGVGGYKIAWNAPQAYTPAVGHIFNAFIRQSGGHIPAGDVAELALEPEILVVMGADVSEPGQTGASIAPSIASYHVGFEIMDRRNSGADVFGHPPLIVANNVLNSGLVLGAGQASLPENIETVLTLDGEEVFRATNAAPQPPAEAVAFIANHLVARGGGLKAGDVILCGTHYPPFVVQRGSTLDVSMGDLGRATFSFG